MCVPVPTDQEILDGLRTAYYEIAVNGASSYTINGRSWTALDLDKLQKGIDHYETKVSNASRRMFAGGTFREPR